MSGMFVSFQPVRVSPRLPERSKFSQLRALRGANSMGPGRGVSESSKAYVVVEGDTLWDIAQRNECSVSSLLKMNGMTPKKANIFPGQVLQVPFKPAPAPQAATTAADKASSVSATVPAAAPNPAAPAQPSRWQQLQAPVAFGGTPPPTFVLPVSAKPPPIISPPSFPIFAAFPFSAVSVVAGTLILVSVPLLWPLKDRLAAATLALLSVLSGLTAAMISAAGGVIGNLSKAAATPAAPPTPPGPEGASDSQADTAATEAGPATAAPGQALATLRLLITEAFGRLLVVVAALRSAASAIANGMGDRVLRSVVLFTDEKEPDAPPTPASASGRDGPEGRPGSALRGQGGQSSPQPCSTSDMDCLIVSEGMSICVPKSPSPHPSPSPASSPDLLYASSGAAADPSEDEVECDVAFAGEGMFLCTGRRSNLGDADHAGGSQARSIQDLGRVADPWDSPSPAPSPAYVATSGAVISVGAASPSEAREGSSGGAQPGLEGRHSIDDGGEDASPAGVFLRFYGDGLDGPVSRPKFRPSAEAPAAAAYDEPHHGDEAAGPSQADAGTDDAGARQAAASAAEPEPLQTAEEAEADREVNALMSHGDARSAPGQGVRTRAGPSAPPYSPDTDEGGGGPGGPVSPSPTPSPSQGGSGVALQVVLDRLGGLLNEQSRRAVGALQSASRRSTDSDSVDLDLTAQLGTLEQQLQSLRRGLASARVTLQDEMNTIKEEAAAFSASSPSHAAIANGFPIETPEAVQETPPELASWAASAGAGGNAIPQGLVEGASVLPVPLSADFTESPEAVAAAGPYGVALDLSEAVPQGWALEAATVPVPLSADFTESPEAVASPAPGSGPLGADAVEAIPQDLSLERETVPVPLSAVFTESPEAAAAVGVAPPAVDQREEMPESYPWAASLDSDLSDEADTGAEAALRSAAASASQTTASGDRDRDADGEGRYAPPGRSPRLWPAATADDAEGVLAALVGFRDLSDAVNVPPPRALFSQEEAAGPAGSSRPARGMESIEAGPVPGTAKEKRDAVRMARLQDLEALAMGSMVEEGWAPTGESDIRSAVNELYAPPLPKSDLSVAEELRLLGRTGSGSIMDGGYTDETNLDARIPKAQPTASQQPTQPPTRAAAAPVSAPAPPAQPATPPVAPPQPKAPEPPTTNPIASLWKRLVEQDKTTFSVPAAPYAFRQFNATEPAALSKAAERPSPPPPPPQPPAEQPAPKPSTSQPPPEPIVAPSPDTLLKGGPVPVRASASVLSPVPTVDFFPLYPMEVEAGKGPAAGASQAAPTVPIGQDGGMEIENGLAKRERRRRRLETAVLAWKRARAAAAAEEAARAEAEAAAAPPAPPPPLFAPVSVSQRLAQRRAWASKGVVLESQKDAARERRLVKLVVAIARRAALKAPRPLFGTPGDVAEQLRRKSVLERKTAVAANQKGAARRKRLAAMMAAESRRYVALEARRQEASLQDLGTIGGPSDSVSRGLALAASPRSEGPGLGSLVSAAAALGANSGLEGSGAAIIPWEEVVRARVAAQEAAYARVSDGLSMMVERRRLHKAQAQQSRLAARSRRSSRAEYQARLVASNWKEQKLAPLATADGALLYKFDDLPPRSFPVDVESSSDESRAKAKAHKQGSAPDVTDVASAMAARTVERQQQAGREQAASAAASAPEAAPAVVPVQGAQASPAKEVTAAPSDQGADAAGPAEPPPTPPAPTYAGFVGTLPPGLGKGANRLLHPIGLPPVIVPPAGTGTGGSPPASPPRRPAPPPTDAQAPPTPARPPPTARRSVPQQPAPTTAATRGPGVAPRSGSPTRRAQPPSAAPPAGSAPRVAGQAPSKPARRASGSRDDRMADWEAVEASSWGVPASRAAQDKIDKSYDGGGFAEAPAPPPDPTKRRGPPAQSRPFRSPEAPQEQEGLFQWLLRSVAGQQTKTAAPQAELPPAYEDEYDEYDEPDRGAADAYRPTEAAAPSRARPAATLAPAPAPAPAARADRPETPAAPAPPPPAGQPGDAPTADGTSPLVGMFNMSAFVFDVIEDEARRSNSKMLEIVIKQLRNTMGPGTTMDGSPASAAQPQPPPQAARPPPPPPPAADDPWRETKAGAPTDVGLGKEPAPPPPPPAAPRASRSTQQPPQPPQQPAEGGALDRIKEAEMVVAQLQEAVLAREAELKAVRDQLQSALNVAQANGQQARVARAAVSAAKDLASALQDEIEALEDEVERLRVAKQQGADKKSGKKK